MNVLIVGSGGREHAIAASVAKSPRADKIFCAPGNAGLAEYAQCVPIGATVHFVDAGTDTGPIILQKAVKVKDGDTSKELQRRVMEKAEWKILPEAINLIANDKITVTDGIVSLK